MNVKNTQRLSQAQTLRLSPMQVRLGRMLEMSAQEARDEVRRELDDNPALEQAETGEAADATADDFGESAEQLQLADWRADDAMPAPRAAGGWGSGETYAELPAEQSLADALGAQLGQEGLTKREAETAAYVINCLDSNGWLTRNSSQMAADLSLDSRREVTVDEIKEAMTRVRRLEPAGIGAVDLRDCLLLQLDRKIKKGATDQSVLDARALVADYFDLLASRRHDKITEESGLARQRVDAAIEAIRSLDPRPGAAWADNAADSHAAQITPDFAVEVGDDGSVTVTVLNTVPELCLSQSFNATKTDPFVRRKRDEAQDFISMLRRRADTLLRVMQSIARRQRAFFQTEDPARLRPMVLRDVAADTGLDLSAVSRAAAGKYVATAGGLYPLKYFFGAAAAGDSTAPQIIEKIKEIVAAEDPARPRNDDELRDILAKEGYELARRTVAKYRDLAGIAPARARRQGNG